MQSRSWLRRVASRVLRTVHLAPYADLEQARSEATRSRAAERARADHQRAAASARIEGLEAKLVAAQEQRKRVRGRLAEEQHAVAAARERIAELRKNALERETALAAARTTARRLTAIQRAARDRIASRLALAAAVQEPPPDPLVARREAEWLQRCEEYAHARETWLRQDAPAGTTQVTIAGLRWSVPADRGDAASLSRRIIDRAWLPLEDIAFVRQFAGGGVMLDVGGNIGTTSIPRVMLDEFAAAYVAEPNADNYLCLVGNVLDNRLAGRVMPDGLAISNVSGAAALRRASTIGGHQLLAAPGAAPADTVRCMTMDDWMQRIAVPPADVSFVKVDTQGWDLQVLEGAGSLLALQRAVWQIEVSPSMMNNAGRSIQDLCAFVTQHFGRVVAINGSESHPVRPASEAGELLASELATRRFTNLLLLHGSDTTPA